MSEFVFYLKQGVNHIIDPEGIDHMVFVITMCAFYKFEDWKKNRCIDYGFYHRAFYNTCFGWFPAHKGQYNPCRNTYSGYHSGHQYF